MIYGVAGSGKTTLARQIGERTGLPWHAVDDLTWEPGWVAVPDQEQRQRIAAICAGERWVLDNAYGKWLDVPLERVRLVVGLDDQIEHFVSAFQRVHQRVGDLSAGGGAVVVGHR